MDGKRWKALPDVVALPAIVTLIEAIPFCAPCDISLTVGDGLNFGSDKELEEIR